MNRRESQGRKMEKCFKSQRVGFCFDISLTSTFNLYSNSKSTCRCGRLVLLDFERKISSSNVK